MKKLFKVACILFCAAAMYACSSDDEVTKSVLQTEFIEVTNSEYAGGSLPVGDNSEMIQSAYFDRSALPGGTAYLTLNSYEELSYVNVGVQGQEGYLKVKLENPVVAQAQTRADIHIYTYTVIILLSQNLSSSFTLVFTTINTEGDISSMFTSETEFVEAGTGDLQVNLHFSNEKDVDLYVVEPNGNVIYYGQTFPYYSLVYTDYNEWLSSGDYENVPDIEWGEIGLDIDSNAGCNIDGLNSENIFFNEECMQKGTYQVWVNMYANCDPSTATSYTVRATYKGVSVTPTSGSNPASGIFPVNTPSNSIGDQLTGATKVMEFTINEGIEASRSAIKPAHSLIKGELSRIAR